MPVIIVPISGLNAANLANAPLFMTSASTPDAMPPKIDANIVSPAAPNLLKIAFVPNAFSLAASLNVPMNADVTSSFMASLRARITSRLSWPVMLANAEVSNIKSFMLAATLPAINDCCIPDLRRNSISSAITWFISILDKPN